MARILNRSKVVAVLLTGLLLGVVGCGESTPDTTAEAVEKMNASSSGLVQVHEDQDRNVTAKYLTPRYLALAETGNNIETESLDSLTSLYQQNLSFYVSISDRSEEEVELPTHQEDVVFKEDGSGVMDVEANQRMFTLEYEGKEWHPIVAIPESRVGEADQTWFVVFAIDPRKEFQEDGSLILTYRRSSNDTQLKFTYRVADILPPEIIASTK